MFTKSTLRVLFVIPTTSIPTQDTDTVYYKYMNQSINLKSIAFLSVTLVMLLGYNFISAQVWTPAPANPPSNNTPAPINVGTSTQAKTGNIAANIFAATTEMRSNRYCDALGANCFHPNLVSSSTSDLDGDIIQLAVINAETYGNTLTANSACKREGFVGVWAFEDISGTEDIICFDSTVISGIQSVETFVTAYHALSRDAAFQAYWGSNLPVYYSSWCMNELGLYRCGVGWLSYANPNAVGPSDPAPNKSQRNTYDRICGYMMDGGRWKVGSTPIIYDSGSDNGNTAYYYSTVENDTKFVVHDNDDVDDTIRLTCIGDSVSANGEFWLLSNRPEAYGRAGNMYPTPVR